MAVWLVRLQIFLCSLSRHLADSNAALKTEMFDGRRLSKPFYLGLASSPSIAS